MELNFRQVCAHDPYCTANEYSMQTHFGAIYCIVDHFPVIAIFVQENVSVFVHLLRDKVTFR